MADITYETESAKIRENEKDAKFPHKFKPAEWTHPNGHPRCLECGDEERTGGVCEKAYKLPKRGAFLQYGMAKDLQEVLTLCKQVIEAPVSGLETTRQDLGVRHGPKPHNKLPEAH